MFPKTFDTKVLAFNSKHFFKTSLGQIYEKVGSDDKYKGNLKFKFDIEGGFTNYEGTHLLSHYHEAAYDAYMTAVAFGHILKIKEIDDQKFNSKKEAAKEATDKPQAEDPKPKKQIRNTPVNEKSYFAGQWINKMMMDAFGSSRYYNLVAEQYVEYLKKNPDAKEFPTTVHLTFEPGFIKNLTAETIASMFSEYGDYYLFKDTEDSVFMEFFFLDKAKVKDQQIDSFIKLVKTVPQFKVKEGVVYEKAPKFKAHNICHIR